VGGEIESSRVKSMIEAESSGENHVCITNYGRVDDCVHEYCGGYPCSNRSLLAWIY